MKDPLVCPVRLVIRTIYVWSEMESRATRENFEEAMTEPADFLQVIGGDARIDGMVCEPLSSLSLTIG